MANYSKIFAGSGGLLNVLTDRSSAINFTSSLAEKAALGLYMKNYGGVDSFLKKNTGRDLPGGLEFLAGDNIVSDILKGGYQPHVGAYLAHKVGSATRRAMNAVFDAFSPGLSQSFRNRYEELKKLEISSLNREESDESVQNTKLVLEAFKTIADQHPEKFQEVFFKKFNSSYLSGDRFFCLLEYDYQDIADYSRQGSPKTNRHYQAFLVKNVTTPAFDVENIEFQRFGQKFSIAGTTGVNESISVNYYVDYHQALYRKLYEQMRNLSFVTDTSRYFTMYIIINNPHQYLSGSPIGINPKLTEKSILGLQTWGSIPNGQNNILSVWKYKGVHVKNINQLTYDTASNDLLNLPVVFNHNGCETELFGYNVNNNNEYFDYNSRRYDWLAPEIY